MTRAMLDAFLPDPKPTKVRTQDAQVHIVSANAVWALKDAGVTEPEIAEELGCSRSTVQRALRMRRKAA